MKNKVNESFHEYEEHLGEICNTDCFYCGKEEDILEQGYKKAKKMGEITWDDVLGSDR